MIGVEPATAGLAQQKDPPVGIDWLAAAAPLILSKSGCPVRFSMTPQVASTAMAPKGTA